MAVNISANFRQTARDRATVASTMVMAPAIKASGSKVCNMVIVRKTTVTVTDTPASSLQEKDTALEPLIFRMDKMCIQDSGRMANRPAAER